MSADYINTLAGLYEKLLPKREQVAAAEARLKKILANAARDGHDAKAIDGEAFDLATRRLAARSSKCRAADPGLGDTPLGVFLASTEEGRP